MNNRLITLFAALACLLPALSSCSKDEGLQESQFIYFSITAPYTRIGGVACTVNNVDMTITNDEPIPSSMDLSDVTPYFVLNHEGKGVFVNGEKQTSGKSHVNLNSEVEYSVVSERGTLTYKVRLTKSGTLSTQAGVRLSSYTDLVRDITSDREVWIDEGLRFSEVVFTTRDGRDLRLDMFEVDLENETIDLYPLTPDNHSAQIDHGQPWPVQTIPLQAAAAENAGLRVLGAVNGDLFDSGVTNMPEGPICRDGVFLKDSFLSEATTHYFAVRKDRRAAIGNYSSFLSLQQKFTFAIGANEYLLENDAPGAAVKNDKTRAFRIGVGTNSLDHKTVYIISIEGSATKLELAYLMKLYGASDAVNLDGGPSVTFVVKENGSFTAVNRVGGALRPVANGIAIIKKQ